MKKLIFSLILFAALSFFSQKAEATTYYVRTDGGTSSQCNGTADAAYDGAGGPDNCAFSHPFYATGWCGDYPSSCTAGAMSGGDDIVISCNSTGDCTGVTFNMGYNASWSGCNAAWSYGCVMQPLPDGTSPNHTTMKGCSAAGCSDDAKRPGFIGNGRNYWNISVQGTDYFDIQDINTYDTATCGSGHATLGCGSADSAETSVRDNIDVRSASNGTFTDMKVYGAWRYGLFGGSGSNLTFDNFDLSYNSFGGWDGDDCGGAGTCGMTGTITFQNHSKVTYNGCIMTSSLGTIAANGCYSQDQTGYGDGLGFGNTGGNWVFNDTEISHNVSDGLDLLYHNRGAYSGGSVVIRRSLFEGNAGNNVKTPNNLVFEDSYNIANCGYFYGQSFTCSSGTCGASFNHCRASGNAFSIDFKSGDSATPRISNSTVLTNSDVAIMTSGTCTTGINIFYSNNILIGGREFLDDTGINGAGGNDSTSIYYEDGGTCNPTPVESNNHCYGFKEGTSACNGTNSVDGTSVPANYFTGTLLQGPLSGPGYYTNANYYTQVDLHASSTARDAADESFSGANSTDYNNYDRGASWDLGALEYGSVPSGGGGGGTPNPTGVWYGSFYSGTLD